MSYKIKFYNEDYPDTVVYQIIETEEKRDIKHIFEKYVLDSFNEICIDLFNMIQPDINAADFNDNVVVNIEEIQ